MTSLTRPERALGLVMLLAAPGAIVLAWASRADPWGWSALVAVSLSAALVGIDPRRHRPLALPILGAALALFVGAVVHGWLVTAACTGVGFVAVTVLFVGAVRAVNGSWLRGGGDLL